MTAKSDPECIRKLKNKLIEASRIYSKDKETVSNCSICIGQFSMSPHAHGIQVSWFVMQNVFDSREFTIVERYEKESSQQYHLNNPYWKTFDPYVLPLLDKPMDLRRHEELDTSQDVQVD
jgi:hypothetical protein